MYFIYYENSQAQWKKKEFILHIELFWKKGQIARRIANPVR